jgi:hypothetical protein
MDNQELIKMIQHLNEKMDSMQKNEYHFHIDKLTVEHLQLEELAYHLEKIDIKELSGMMNLGNMFNPELKTVKSQSNKPFEKKSDNDRDQPPNISSKHQDEKRDEPALSVVINGKEISLNEGKS